ncbi:MAG: serine O-acetyltransferase [Rhodospirillaceae bacterium]
MRQPSLLESIKARDPAARSVWEIALLYPGVRALVFHRIAHGFWRTGFKFMGRFVSEIGRWLSGIEIHPGATIGKRLFIDHGTGVVIGETAIIGNDVTLYHGVTLGGIATSIITGRRHPVVEDNVIIGAGAQVLGAITVGRDARVGANAVVVKDVPPGVTVVGIPAQVALPRAASKAQTFVPYGSPCDDLPDPTQRAICGLLNEVEALRRRVAQLEGERSHTISGWSPEDARPAGAQQGEVRASKLES